MEFSWDQPDSAIFRGVGLQTRLSPWDFQRRTRTHVPSLAAV